MEDGSNMYALGPSLAGFGKNVSFDKTTYRWLRNHRSYLKIKTIFYIIDIVSSFLNSTASFGLFLIWALFGMFYLIRQM